MDELLLKFLEQKATLSEETTIRLWLESSDDHLYYFRYFASSWNQYCTLGNSLLFKSIAAIQ
ncbi:MAG: hypothetical protein KF746_03315 [Chitinophagaceae bacterium]|nr:hypothetical protein [Chitinophagaceae bacterium]